MDHRSKYKMQNYKIARIRHRRKLRWPWVWHDFLDTPPKTWFHERKISLTSLKLKTSVLQKTMGREWEDKPQTGRKYLQKRHLKKDSSPKYIKKTLKTQKWENN